MIASPIAVNVFLFCVSALCIAVVIVAIAFLVDVIHDINKDLRNIDWRRK